MDSNPSVFIRVHLWFQLKTARRIAEGRNDAKQIVESEPVSMRYRVPG
jgi:hypothetical protein